MLIVVFLSVLSPLLPALYPISTVWVWADSETDAKKVRDREVLYGAGTRESVIRLKYDDPTILIDFVFRGKSWPSGESFCTSMLPAVMEEFISFHDIEIESVKKLSVVNASTPSLWGCKCYLRLFVWMGFTEVNDEIVESEFDITRYCFEHPESDYMTAHVPSGSVGKIPGGIPEAKKTKLLESFVY